MFESRGSGHAYSRAGEPGILLLGTATVAAGLLAFAAPTGTARVSEPLAQIASRASTWAGRADVSAHGLPDVQIARSRVARLVLTCRPPSVKLPR
jgi:hypothetical protein